MSAVDLTILIVNYNTAHLLDEMFGAIRRASPPEISAQIIVIDNASVDNSVEVLQEKYPDVRLITNQKNVGFGRANNQGIPFIEGRYVLLLNTDAFVSQDTFSKTIAYMDAHPRCGLLGVKLVGRDGTLQPSCRYFPTPWNMFLSLTGLNKIFRKTRLVDDMAWDHASVRQCDWVPGCYYLIRREVVDQVGLFDSRYFLYCEEVDHCQAVKKAGWEGTDFPDTTVIHIGGESAKSQGDLTSGGRQVMVLQAESEILYIRKHHGLFMLIMHLLLSMLADLIVMSKLIWHGRYKPAMDRTRRIVLMWQRCMATRFGILPTR